MSTKEERKRDLKIFQILVDDIEDPDTVNRIAVKLKAKMGEHESEG